MLLDKKAKTQHQQNKQKLLPERELNPEPLATQSNALPLDLWDNWSIEIKLFICFEQRN